MPSFVLTLADDADPQGVCDHVAASGATILSRLETLGLVVVETAPEHVARLRAIPGVVAVEAEQDVSGLGAS